MSIFQNLIEIIEKKGSAYIVLIDPDKKNNDKIEDLVEKGNRSNVDAFFVGGSLIMDSKYESRVKSIKNNSDIPVILFPGGVNQINSHFDAMLFISMISGRNPQYLIGEQVISAPIIKDLGIETISTGYILIDGGVQSMVQVMSDTNPIPMDRIDAIIAHALAAQYLGMKLIYLEAGSGATKSVNDDIIKSVSKSINIPLVVGGGLRDPETVSAKVNSGASIIVTGTIAEEDSSIMREVASAVHWKNQ
ncbi:MAG: geranylgeranylglyceryl/heptaprenylglyceryl phosphate synthase [Candidatus Neomarinimicrobiota bacterium]